MAAAKSAQRENVAVSGALRELVEGRLQELSQLSLSDLLDAAPELRALSPSLERGIRERRSAILEELAGAPLRQEELATQLAGATRGFLEREHQFLEIEGERERTLQELCARLTRDAVGSLAREAPWSEVAGELRGHLARHQQRLRALVALLLEDCGSLPGAAGVVCAEYSPELQLRVLGLRAEELRAPLLDLGCGASGALVRQLRRLGHDPVWGLDRCAPAEPGFVRGSWFSAALPEPGWRTVLAHQSFSLHFLHAHLHSAERAARFAARYLEILRGLAPGGRFLYAPGLPFIESALPAAEFEVTVRPVGTSGLQAACVRRAG